MPLQHIRISHFRNLDSVDIRPSPSLNFLYGVNGSGKTSLLEALSVLAHGRSFRTRKFRRLIQLEQPSFTVYGQLYSEVQGKVAMGVTRTRAGDSQFKVGGAPVTSSADLAAQLPLLVVNADAFGLLTGPPKQRRQFFDWLVFHVKQDFRVVWRDYSRCVKQRNSLLRRDKITYSDVRPWDLEIARLSAAIEAARLACVEPLLHEFEILIRDLDLGDNQHIEISYLSGWKAADDYAQQLAEAFLRDRKLGYTSLGPHKSDLKICVGGLPAGEVLSRGQQKSMISALYVAEARVFSGSAGRDCVLLIDDMPAELDSANMRRVGQWVNSTAAQVFVTAVDHGPLYAAWPDLASRPPKVFHVKHGEVTEADGQPDSAV